MILNRLGISMSGDPPTHLTPHHTSHFTPFHNTIPKSPKPLNQPAKRADLGVKAAAAERPPRTHRPIGPSAHRPIVLGLRVPGRSPEKALEFTPTFPILPLKEATWKIFPSNISMLDARWDKSTQTLKCWHEKDVKLLCTAGCAKHK